MEGRKEGWKGRWMNGWMNEWKEGMKDGWRLFHILLYYSPVFVSVSACATIIDILRVFLISCCLY